MSSQQFESSQVKQILDELSRNVIDSETAAARLQALHSGEQDGPAEAIPESFYDDPSRRGVAHSGGGEHMQAGAQRRADSSEAADKQSREHPDLTSQLGGLAAEVGAFASATLRRIARPAGEPGSASTTPADFHSESRVGAISRVRVHAVGRRVTIIGDPSVANLVASGPHKLRRSGDVLEVATEGELRPSFDGFSVLRPPRGLEDLRLLGGKELVLRVNPAIIVDAEVTGGRLQTSGLGRLGRIRISAGGAQLGDVVEINDALIQACGALISGPLSHGRSRVRVESGHLTVKLSAAANVTVHAETQLGRVNWPGDTRGDLDEYVVGNGSARLDLSVVMGRVVVRAQEPANPV